MADEKDDPQVNATREEHLAQVEKETGQFFKRDGDVAEAADTEG